ncbi:hypothetical protein ACIHCM_36795 [Streptomyces sp. NPDC052023]|uniref:Rv1733c family protein n=1 Tax=Streptomyces sp. NPDC052023 TaxID=3365681 RepID=UPI0037D165C9
MSAQNSPQASGPLPPRQEHASQRANPLRRTSDRFEAWFRRVLLLVLVLGLPVAAVSAGQATYESSMRTAHVQAAERQKVTARLMSHAKGDTEAVKQPAQVRWTDRNGTVRTGIALVQSGTPKGATVSVWVARGGTVTGPPMTELQATTDGWFMGGAAAIGVIAGFYATRATVRLVLDRSRYARWDTEWGLVEPLWSARFRR